MMFCASSGNVSDFSATAGYTTSTISPRDWLLSAAKAACTSCTLPLMKVSKVLVISRASRMWRFGNTRIMSSKAAAMRCGVSKAMTG